MSINWRVLGSDSCRHYRYEQTLACLLWKVDMKDVTIISSPDLAYCNDSQKKTVVS